MFSRGRHLTGGLKGLGGIASRVRLKAPTWGIRPAARSVRPAAKAGICIFSSRANRLWRRGARGAPFEDFCWEILRLSRADSWTRCARMSCCCSRCWRALSRARGRNRNSGRLTDSGPVWFSVVFSIFQWSSWGS